MSHFSQRRAMLFASAMIPFARIVTANAAKTNAAATTATSRGGALIHSMFAELERTSNGRLGLAALDTANGRQIGYRADERFPFCSTFKVVLTGAILAQSVQRAGYMQQHIDYAQSDVVNYSPISGKHVADGMSIEALCAAAIEYSDNTAANLLIRQLGGQQAVTSFARSIGNAEFRLDRTETELNTAIPGDLRDTATPASMMRTMQTLTLGDALPTPQRAQLLGWLAANTTGAKRIRAGVPADWQVGDKTGTGDYGTANDLAVLWPPGRAPIVLAIYHTQRQQDAKTRDEVIASAARIVVGALV